MINTPFTADHVGTYEVTVMSIPEACIVESRKFILELIQCSADVLYLDSNDSVFKSGEPTLSYKID